MNNQNSDRFVSWFNKKNEFLGKLGNHIYVVYSGMSMYPTLRNPMLIEVRPYRDQFVLQGDVIYFTFPGKNLAIVHRVVGITSRGLLTCGDNNQMIDDWVISQDQVIGKVSSAWVGKKRYKIFGGWIGYYYSYINKNLRRIVKRLKTTIAHLFRYLPLRRYTCNLPIQLMFLRVIFLPTPGDERFLLIRGKKLIGHYTDGKWQIHAPYRWLINQHNLHILLDKNIKNGGE